MIEDIQLEQIPERAIFIPGNVPSLKNSKQIMVFGGKKALVPSKTHRKYHKATLPIWKELGSVFRARTESDVPPFEVKFYFVRDSRRRFDYTSAIDTCQDIMSEAGWWEDDNADICKPRAIGYHVQKEKAGVWIWV